MCSWPTNSSRERGRIRVASGAAGFVASILCSSSNRSCTKEDTLLARIVHLVVATTRGPLSLTRHRHVTTVHAWNLSSWRHCGLRSKGPISEKLRWHEIAHPPASAIYGSRAHGYDWD